MMIEKYIDQINNQYKKVYSIYLTSGFPDTKNFVKIALNLIESGADILELGIPFSDPMADGPVIQFSSDTALKNGVKITDILKFTEQIRNNVNIPIVIMTYANPVLAYGVNNFYQDFFNSGANGVIIPDIPLEEFKQFKSAKLQNILLAAPNLPEERIKKIDKLSKGFVYGVSVTGVTGERNNLAQIALQNVKKLRDNVRNNKLLIGFGINSKETIQNFSNFCDGFIIGSAIIKKLIDDKTGQSAVNFLKTLKE
ncbi:MAG TPA: tryptophan synthase subunit alpha [Ignavibacteriales bacterium]|jgi:tryptophan synthase alpha chain|nr:tryptophan synthase subunit alpha [Ignavibacteriales bacterium]